MMGPFDWRRLTDASAVVYRLDESGRIDLLSESTAPPFDTARVRDGSGGFKDSPLESLGLVWAPAGDQAWELRTHGAPTTMAHVHARWGEIVSSIAPPAGVDPRFVLTTIACEAGSAGPDAGGYVKAPRTEQGYPRRTGESDPGDEARDAEDWSSSGGTHSSHGLMQTLISTAYGVRHDLFAGVDPSRYREVLWRPENSIAAGVAYLASFPPAMRADPIALRFAYGAGSVRPSTSNRWGVVLYDELVPLNFVAFWNDLAAVMTGAGAPLSPPGTNPMWLAIGVSLLAVAGVGLYLQARHTKQLGAAA